MTNMTLAFSDGTSERMKRYREIRWTEIARRAIEQRLNDLELMDRLASKSKLTQKDVRELTEKIKTSAASKYMK
jgi:hypothetical protein